MIIGAALNCFRGLSPREATRLYEELAAELGLEAVEVSLEEAPGGDTGRPGLASFLERFRVSGAHLPFEGLNPVSVDEVVRERSLRRLGQAIETAASLRVDYVVMHAAEVTEGLSHGEQVKQWREVISGLARFAEKRSLMLCIENCGFLGDLWLLAELVKAVDLPNLGITLDTGHAHVRRVRQPAGLLRYPPAGLLVKALDYMRIPIATSRYMPFWKYGSLSEFALRERPWIKSLHLHDHDGRHDHLPIGSGRVDFSFLSGIGDTPLILEIPLLEAGQDLRRNVQRIRTAAGVGARPHSTVVSRVSDG